MKIVRYEDDVKECANSTPIHEIAEIHDDMPCVCNNMLIEDGMITGIIIE